MKRIALLVAGLMVGLLAGCGAGGSSPFQDFFGPGTSPGSAYAQEVPGRVEGLVVRRQRDQRILILSGPEAVTEPSTPLAGVTIAIPEYALSATTGPSGTYLFDELTPGDLTLRVTLPAADGGATANFAFRLDPGETLRGLPAGAEQ